MTVATTALSQQANILMSNSTRKANMNVAAVRDYLADARKKSRACGLKKADLTHAVKKVRSVK